MRQIVVDAPNARPVLHQAPEPRPGPDEVRVRITACGLNFADLLMIEGRYQSMPGWPLTPGLEVAGVVEETGPGVLRPSVGTPVAVFTGHGGLAEVGVFPADRCVPLPRGIDPIIAAGFQIAYGTSHLALTHVARLQQGETLLVLGAAGGVGLTAVELGALMGARVIAAARGADKLAVARAAGAQHLLDTDAVDIRTAVGDLGGADVVYDPIGGPAFGAAMRATRPGGRMLIIGFAGGEVQQIPANHLLVKNITAAGFYWGGYLNFAPDLLHASLSTLFGWLSARRLRPHVSHVLPLDRTEEGLFLLRSRKATGKVVITMD